MNKWGLFLSSIGLLFVVFYPQQNNIWLLVQGIVLFILGIILAIKFKKR